jgi:D-lyxose ketol-isomerase
LEEWKQNKNYCDEIFVANLGWDITDFGSGDFEKRGLFLVTLRNGVLPYYEKPYAEKIMIIKENQETPLHYHWHKQEDIINRVGGVLVMDVFGVGENDNPVEQDIMVHIDGVETLIRKGKSIYLNPGQSITMPKGVYHRFYAKEGFGYVLAGEVSSPNDDDADNRFFEKIGRFPLVEEDQDPLRLMIPDYKKFLDL